MGNIRYFNVPIMLVSDVLLNKTHNTLNCVFDYAMYSYLDKTHKEPNVLFICESEEYFGVTVGNRDKTFQNGKQIFESTIHEKLPKVGINKDVFFYFYKNKVSEYEKEVWLMFLAIKSIVGTKAYCKVTKMYILSRMDGKSKVVSDENELSPAVRKYYKRYWFDKVKEELEVNWGMKTYGKRSRGLFISFDMTYDDLVYQVEKRKNTKEKLKEIRQVKEEAEIKAKARLQSEMITIRANDFGSIF